MNNKIFALDIREDGLCAVLVRTGLKENRLENHAQVFYKDAPDPEQAFQWGLGKITGRMDPSGAFCLVSVPPTDVSFRNLSVPFKSRKKIRQILPFELEPTLPFEVDEMKFDFLTVRQADHSDLIAAVVETARLDVLMDVLEVHGISPGFVTTGGVTAALCIADLYEARPETFLLIESHPYSATVCIVVSGEIYLIRTFRKNGQPDSRSAARELSKGINRMISAFETIYDADLQPEKLLFSGRDATDPDFVHALGDFLQIEASAVNLATDARLNISVPENLPVSPEINGALGLAGIETAGLAPFNFSRRHSALEKNWNENRTQLIATGILAAFVFALFMTYAVLDAHFLEKRVSRLDDRITAVFQTTFPGVERIVDPVQQMRSRLQEVKGKKGFSEDVSADVRNIDILKDISRLVPARTNVVITRFVRDEGSVRLSGLTDTFNAVDDIKMQLEKSSHLSGITISSANMDQAADRIRFRIRADLSAGQQ
ncbi:MAG: PilN domain-containing protein [Desulfobacterales bacterium]|nr:PilN domain-containing protein [Desulfobacterales bacterium]